MDKIEDKNERVASTAHDSSAKLIEEVKAKVAGPNSVATTSDAAKSVIPPYLLQEMAKRNPNDDSFNQTLTITQNEKLGPFEPRVPSGANGAREVYDAKGTETHPGDKVRFEGDPASGNNDADKVYDYTGQVRDYYKNVLGRDSIDNKGMKMISTVNYGQNFQNAFWNGKQMTYGHPSDASPFKTFALLDVTGHEITHGVTQNTSGILYWGQAGALNESISDVFGELIQQHALGQSAAQADWVVGDGIWKDGIKGRGLRDMLNPGTAYDDPKIGKDPQPGHMKDYVSTWKDNGGVHYNSGIPNHAFALFATAVGGNAWDKPGKIWYEATQHIGMLPSFASFAEQTIIAAKKLGTPDDVAKLKKAWADVGVAPSAKARDTLTPSEPIGPAEDKEQDRNGPILDPAPRKKAS